MDPPDVPWTEPIASTSRAVFTLPYKADEQQDADQLGYAAGVEAYRAAWRATHDRIQDTLSTLHDASLDQIVAFVRAPESTDASLYTALSGRALLRTGLIIGASPGSSSLLYSSLVRQLSSVDSDTVDESAPTAVRPCLISRLASRDCSNIKNALRSLIGGFIGSSLDVDLEDEDDEEEDAFLAAPVSRKSEMIVPEDMHNLRAWYEHRYAKQDAQLAPKLVVLIEDLEAMDGKVLTQIIDTLSTNADSLPLTLLVGIATTADALWNLLARKTANQLDAASFFVDPGVGAFNALMRGLFIDWKAPLALSPRVYETLWRTFEDLHHSIDATISFLQQTYMTHYIASPAHALTPRAGLDDEDAAAAVKALQELQCYSAASQGSSAEPAVVLEEARAAYRAWHTARREAFAALTGMMEFWDKRKPLEGVLAAVLGEGEGGRNIHKTVDELCNLVLQASSAKLPTFVRAVIANLSALHADLDSELDLAPGDTLLRFAEAQLASLEPILAAPRPAGRSTLFNTNLVGAFSIPGMGTASKVDQGFSALAKETAEGLRTRLRHSFRPHTELALHELWFSDDRSAVKRVLPAPLPTTLRLLQKDDALTERNGDAENGAESAEPSDLSVAYRTFTETHPQGRLANLGEWWGAFELSAANEVEVNGAEGQGEGARKRRRRSDEDGDSEDEDENEDEDEGPERRKQARFLRVVGDLAHLGFIHPTTYKPEHVLKSVY
ncbi:hypothetical protein BMF94_0176 [Rhodotorula taiwanensis]|uniref:Uncharacterized protein n=1 Tax=Rhodotorula taiwanensis TaxID=741276 RepID=A0A2S5BIJ0_9BASI|nr:hypothetical protein BMF94_0176 [Rhodotorula taiwanensis]